MFPLHLACTYLLTTVWELSFLPTQKVQGSCTTKHNWHYMMLLPEIHLWISELFKCLFQDPWKVWMKKHIMDKMCCILHWKFKISNQLSYYLGNLIQKNSIWGNDKGMTPLHLACWSQSNNIVTYVLDKCKKAQQSQT